MKLNMFPSFIVKNTVNCCWINSIFFRKFININSIFPNFSKFKNIFLFKFCKMMRLSHRESSFFHRIKCIFFICSKKKVSWTYANYVIAFMTYAFIGRNFSVTYNPRNSMCLYFSKSMKLPISFSTLVPTTSENPAGSGFLDMIKETFDRSYLHAIILAYGGHTI